MERITGIRSGLDFVSMFAQWIGAKDKLISSNCNYFVNDICSTKALVLDGNLQLKDFSSLPSDPINN